MIADTQAGISLCIAGSRKVIINGNPYHVKEGMLCIISPLVSVLELSRDQQYREIQLVDDIDVFYQVIRQVYNTVLSMRLRETPCMMLTEENIRFFKERTALIEEKRIVMNTTTNKEERHILRNIIRHLVQATILEVVHLFYKNRAVSPESPTQSENVVIRFLSSLNINYKSQRSVAFYAAEANLSQSHFSRLIKLGTGLPPSEWITTVTIINAKQLLVQTDMSIKEIASELNFPEQFTFRKFFKQYVGIPPTEYRHKMKRER